MCKTSKSANWKWRMVAFKVKVAPTNPFLRVKLWSTRFFHYCSEWHWWVFAGKLASSIQTMGGCGNLLATKAFARKFFLWPISLQVSTQGILIFLNNQWLSRDHQPVFRPVWLGPETEVKIVCRVKGQYWLIFRHDFRNCKGFSTKHSKIVSSQLLSTPKLWAQCNRRT